MLEKIQQLNILQRIWIFIIGKKMPNTITQVSVAIAFLTWLYFFSWQLITFLSMSFMDSLDNASALERAFARVGSEYSGYIFGNVTSYLLVHSLIQMIVMSVALIGLIFIWRQKKIGFLLYIFSNAAIYVVTFFVLGSSYMWNELSMIDFALLLAVTLYFFGGYWLFYRNK